MISICIPIYNYNATKLVSELHKQAQLLDIDYEFVLIDDASDAEHRPTNRLLLQLDNVVYRENTNNIGLSKMRNRLAHLAKYPYLLFIDSDALVYKPDYLQEYLKYCIPGIVCFGGCIYTDKVPDKKHILRWKYGKRREEGVGKYYSCFNLLVDAKLIHEYPFSEELNHYGYEDCLFGATLEHAGANMTYIHNPMLHPGLDTAKQYINKIKLSIDNLLTIEPYLAEKNMVHSVRLLHVYHKLSKFHLDYIVALGFIVLKPFLVINLKSRNPQLFVLDFYKIGLLCLKKLKQKQKQGEK